MLHVGTNDLNTERSPKHKAKSIVEFVTMLKGNPRDISVSNITVRTDSGNLNETGCEVNADLTKKVQRKNNERHKRFEKDQTKSLKWR